MNSELVFNSDGSVSITTVFRGASDEELTNAFLKAGWGTIINPMIRADRRLEVSGKPVLEVGTKRRLTIRQAIPDGEFWTIEQIAAKWGLEATMAFDLEDLADFLIGRNEVIRAHGIRFVVASGARFLDIDKRDAVINPWPGELLDPSCRCVLLANAKRRFGSDEWFGFSEPCDT